MYVQKNSILNSIWIDFTTPYYLTLSSPKYNFSSNHYLTLLASESALGNRCGKRTSGARNHRFFYLDYKPRSFDFI